MKLTKALIVCLLILSRAAHSVEPEEEMLALETTEATTEKSADLFQELERKGGWLGRAAKFGETLDGRRTSQLLAQELFREGPPVKAYILLHLPLPYKNSAWSVSRMLKPTGLRAVFNHAGDKVFTISDDEDLVLWDIEKETAFTKEVSTGEIKSAVFNDMGDKVVAASNDHTSICDVETGKALKILRGHTARVSSAVFNSRGDRVITASYDRTARIWDVETENTIRILEGHTKELFSAVFNSRGDRVITASSDQTARIWDVETGRTIHVLAGHTGFVCFAAFNHSGDKVVTASWDETARIWDVETGKIIHALEGHAETVRTAVFNSTGDKVLTVSDDGIAKIWDVETGKIIHALEDDSGSAVFSSLGDKVLTVSDDGIAKIWDAETGKILHALPVAVDSAVFNSTGDRVLTAIDKESGISFITWSLEPLLEGERFLEDACNFLQAALLNDIFEVIKARYYLDKLRENEPETVAHLEGRVPCFDFNKYPLAIWNEYTRLPQGIRRLLDSYITRPSSAKVEQNVLSPIALPRELLKRKNLADGDNNPAKRRLFEREDE